MANITYVKSFVCFTNQKLHDLQAGVWDSLGFVHACETWEMNKKFWSENWKTNIVMSKGGKNCKLRL